MRRVVFALQTLAFFAVRILERPHGTHPSPTRCRPGRSNAPSWDQRVVVNPQPYARMSGMTGPARILLVDDQQQVSRVLRSSLELSGEDYFISEASSAEEALVEISRGPVDLLVTDLRLPGISGLELVERLRQINPRSRAILITGSPTEDVRRRAEALGVVAFLRKPVGTNAFVEIVNAALEMAAREAAAEEQERPLIVDRLLELRTELGAEAIMLIDEHGQIVVRAGDLVGADIEGVIPSLMAANRSGLQVSAMLGASAPANFQHIDGGAHDVYLTNVGRAYSLLIAYRGGQGAGQMGSVVHYGRRAADELLNTLGDLGVPEAGLAAMKAGEKVMPEESEEVEIHPDDLDAAAESVDADDAEDFWEEAAASQAKPETSGDELSYDQARQLGILDEESEAKEG